MLKTLPYALMAQSVCEAEELPGLVAQILTRLKKERGWSQSDVANDLQNDGGTRPTQGSISKAATLSGGRYEQLQIRIIERYERVRVRKQTLYFLDPIAGDEDK